MQEMGRRLNVTYAIVPSTEGRWGAQLDNGTWTGAFGMMYRMVRWIGVWDGIASNISHTLTTQILSKSNSAIAVRSMVDRRKLLESEECAENPRLRFVLGSRMKPTSRWWWCSVYHRHSTGSGYPGRCGDHAVRARTRHRPHPSIPVRAHHHAHQV